MKVLFCNCKGNLRRMTQINLTSDEVDLIIKQQPDQFPSWTSTTTIKWKCEECQQELIEIENPN